MQRQRATEYSMLRIVGVIFVVIGHSALMTSRTGLGVIDFGDMTLSGALYDKLGFLFDYVYSFHMPLFFFVSGAVYTLSLGNGGSELTLDRLLVSKAKRLLVPYLTYSVLYVIPIRFLLGAYDADTAVRAVSSIFTSTDETLHLWYLYVLFGVFVLYYLLDRFVIKGRNAWAALVGALLFVGGAALPSNFLIPISFLYLLFFIFGCAFEKAREAVNRFILRLWPVFLALFAFYAYLVFVREMIPFWNVSCSNSAVSPFVSRACGLLSVSVSVAAWYIPCVFASSVKGIAQSPVFLWLDRNFFGVYLLHDPLNHVIMYLALLGLRSGALVGVVDSDGILLMRTVGIIAISLLLTALINAVKSRWKGASSFTFKLAVIVFCACVVYTLFISPFITR